MTHYVTHYRPAERRPASCGDNGVMTPNLVDVDCNSCREVNALAEQYAEACGCRLPAVHTGVARAVIELGREQHEPHGYGVSDAHPR